jgi:hypothetical protein
MPSTAGRAYVIGVGAAWRHHQRMDILAAVVVPKPADACGQVLKER